MTTTIHRPTLPAGPSNGHQPDMHWPSVYRPNKHRPVDTTQTPAAAGSEDANQWAKVLDTLRLVGPLLLVNSLAVYGQVAYFYAHITGATWPTFYRVLLAVGFAAAIEAVALYVGWQAHASLLDKHFSAARRRRVASYLIAAGAGGINYAHWANGFQPTEAAVGFGLLSLLSPWLWGMHSRRQQHLQLVREALIDEAGAEFSARRRMRFPIRTFRAVSWSIEHNVRDPYQAWDGYHRERRERRLPVGVSHPVSAPPVATSPPVAKTPPTPRPVDASRPSSPQTVEASTPRKQTPSKSVRKSTSPPTAKPAGTPTGGGKKWPPVAIRDAGAIRLKFGSTADLPGRNELARQMGWNTQKASDARNAYLAGADQQTTTEVT